MNACNRLGLRCQWACGVKKISQSRKAETGKWSCVGKKESYSEQSSSLRVRSILRAEKRKITIESVMEAFFAACASVAVFAVLSMTLYLLLNGLPGIEKVGLKEILFQTKWHPTAEEASFGIRYIILTSVTGTLAAVIIGVPLGILTAIFLAEFADRRAARLVKPAVELLSGIPSVIYGLLGLYLLCPLMYRVERKLFAGSWQHQYTGGANWISAVLILAVMILPTVTHVSETALRGVNPGIREASLGLGATHIQTVFRAVLPAARTGIFTAIVLGVGRAMGEAMAIMMVSGNSVNAPFPFSSVRFLTTALVSEMAYAQGTHRQVLFTIGLVLFVFIMLVNLILNLLARKTPGEKRK